MAKYEIDRIEELKRQLLLSPAEVCRQYADRVEELLRTLEPERTYPYRYLYLSITGFQTDEEAAYRGDHIRPDLLAMLRELSDAAPSRVDEVDEQVLTLEEVQRRCDVSKRTVYRWRQRGLISRKYIFPDGRKRTGVPESALDAFRSREASTVDRSKQFSKINERERREMVCLALRYWQNQGMGLTAAAERIGRELGRARETVRYTLKNYQEEAPHLQLFRTNRSAISSGEKRQILRELERDEPVKEICQRHDRSRSSIYRIANQARAERYLEEDFDYVFNAEFLDEDGDEKILGGEGPEERRAASPPARPQSPEDMDHYLRALYDTPLLEPDEERELFRRYNYIKHKLCRLREQLDPTRYVSSRLLDRMDELEKRATRVKNAIVVANLRLVVNVARKHAGPRVGLFALVSEGNLCLMEAVESFDYGRGNRFSTYLSWALMRRFARTVPEENYREAAGGRGQDVLSEMPGSPERGEGYPAPLSQLGEAVNILDERERTVVRLRYGLGEQEQPLTLRELGQRMGISKQRVQQIEARALRKLRQHLEE